MTRSWGPDERAGSARGPGAPPADRLRPASRGGRIPTALAPRGAPTAGDRARVRRDARPAVQHLAVERAGAGAGAGSGPAPDAAGGPRPSSAGSTRARRSPKRPPKTATPYSTSYDPADEEPFEPGWSGATWYGASSGTYWTINPKEYADPRKHGPEYQARARRARGGWILDGEEQPAGSGDTAEPPDSTDRDSAGDGSDPAQEASAPHAPGSSAEPARHRQHREMPAAAPSPPGSTHRSARPGRSRHIRTSARMRTTGMPFEGAAFGGPPPGAATPAGESTGFHGPVLPQATTPTGRLAVALLGWPPLGLFAAAAIGESSGCGRYAASCGELFSPGTWILSVAILLLLLALPAVARWSAHGTIAMLLGGVPAAVVLSAAGGTNVPGASAPLLVGVLALAYLAGIGYALTVPRLARSG